MLHHPKRGERFGEPALDRRVLVADPARSGVVDRRIGGEDLVEQIEVLGIDRGTVAGSTDPRSPACPGAGRASAPQPSLSPCSHPSAKGRDGIPAYFSAGTVARISHQLATAAADSTASSRPSPSGRLDVLPSTPSAPRLRANGRQSRPSRTARLRRALVRGPRICGTLGGLATRPGEKSGLAAVGGSASGHDLALVVEGHGNRADLRRRQGFDA